MLTFFVFIGVILFALAIASFFIPIIREESEKEVANPNKVYREDPDTITIKTGKSNPALLFVGGKTGRILLFSLGFFLMLTRGLFFWADATEQYFLVYPTGSIGVVTEQGVKFRGFAKITAWQKYMDVKVVVEGGETDGIEGVMKAISIRFIDQVTATVEVSTRFQLPSDHESFQNIAIKFRSMANLVNNTLIPTVKEQVKNAGHMFKAQNYISGEAQNFRQTLDEMMKDGAYKVQKITERDTIWTGDKSREIKEINVTYNVEKVLINGVPVRIDHEITSNNIIVSQVIVDEVLLEAAFKKRLESQRDESAKRQLEQQKVETARDSQQRIIAEGERDKAAERVSQETEQVKTLIAIETKLKQEKTNKELAQIKLETEKIVAQQVIVKADADAYEISKKVRAGITPETRLKMELAAQVAIAAEYAKIKFPTTWIEGGTGGKEGMLSSLIGANLAKGMSGKTGK